MFTSLVSVRALSIGQKIGIGLLVAFVAFFIVIARSVQPQEPAVQRGAPASSGSSTQHVQSSRQYVWLAATQDDINASFAAIAAGDDSGMQQLIQQGRIFPVQSGSAIRILEQRDGLTYVRVLDGTYAGYDGWINTEQIGP